MHAVEQARNMLDMNSDPSQDLRDFLGNDRFGCVMADPLWRFTNRTGKVAPEHKRLAHGLNNGLVQE